MEILNGMRYITLTLSVLLKLNFVCLFVCLFFRCASKWFILTQRTQKLEFVNFKYVTYARPIPLLFNIFFDSSPLQCTRKTDTILSKPPTNKLEQENVLKFVLEKKIILKAKFDGHVTSVPMDVLLI